MSKLVSTGVAAQELGLNRRSLARWAAEGIIEPDLITPGGHMRWDVKRLRQQLRDLAEQLRRDDDTD